MTDTTLLLAASISVQARELATAVALRTGDYRRASQLSRLSDRIDLAIDEPEELTP